MLFGFQAVLLHVRDDANNRHPLRCITAPRPAAPAHTLADGVLIRPDATRHRLVDDRHWWRCLMITFGEGTACVERDTHRLKIARTDAAIVGVRVFAFAHLPLFSNDGVM